MLNQSKLYTLNAVYVKDFSDYTYIPLRTDLIQSLNNFVENTAINYSIIVYAG